MELFQISREVVQGDHGQMELLTALDFELCTLSSITYALRLCLRRIGVQRQT